MVWSAQRHHLNRTTHAHPLTTRTEPHTLTHQVSEFTRLGISFPYPDKGDGTPRLLSAVDFEHSLCYFSRYLSARAELGRSAEGLYKQLYPLQESKKAKRLSIKTLANHAGGEGQGYYDLCVKAMNQVRECQPAINI